MGQEKIDIKAESVPWQVKLIGVLLLVGALTLVMNYWWLSLIFSVAGLTLLSGYSGTEIDSVSKTFREYNSYLLIRRGVTEKYHKIEKVYINQTKVSQTMYTAHTSNSSSFQSVLYNAYLKFDDGRTLFLTSRKNKAKLIKFLNPVVASLGVELSDNTVRGHQHVE
jgi:hypothetical protein